MLCVYAHRERFRRMVGDVPCRSYATTMSPVAASKQARKPSLRTSDYDGVDDTHLLEVCWEVSRKAGGVYTGTVLFARSLFPSP